MAKERREELKQTLLLSFVALNVLLIFLVWADNLIEKPGNQGFIRTTAGPSATLNAETAGPQATATPAPDTPQAPGGPVNTATPYQDAGDIGFLHPRSHPVLEGF